MSEYARSGAGVVERERSATAIEIEVMGRWDALALSERLVPYHSFLVQHERERWVVHARTPGCHGETLADACGRSTTGRPREKSSASRAGSTAGRAGSMG